MMRAGSRGAIAAATLFLASVAADPAPTADGVATGLDDRSILNPLSEFSLDRLQGFRDRPLFVVSRRPPPPEAPPEPEPEYEPEPVAEIEPEPEPEILDVSLSGIMTADDETIAIVRNEATGTTQPVRVGDAVEAWNVVSIGEASVTLERDGDSREIKIFQPGAREGASDQAMAQPGGLNGLQLPGQLGRQLQGGRVLPPGLANAARGLGGIPGLNGQTAPGAIDGSVDPQDIDLQDADGQEVDEQDIEALDEEVYDEEEFADEVFDAGVDDGEFIYDAADENGGAIDDELLEGGMEPDL